MHICDDGAFQNGSLCSYMYLALFKITERGIFITKTILEIFTSLLAIFGDRFFHIFYDKAQFSLWGQTMNNYCQCKKTKKQRYRESNKWPSVTRGSQCAKMELFASKQSDYYIKIVIIIETFNREMNQSSNKILSGQFTKESKEGKHSMNFYIQVEQNHQEAQFKALNFITQILFKKQEKIHYRKLKQSQKQPRGAQQASRTNQNQQSIQIIKKMELNFTKLSTQKKLTLNIQKEGPREIQKGRKVKKQPNSQKKGQVIEVEAGNQQTSREFQKITKKQIKQLKKAEKQKHKQMYHKNNLLSENLPMHHQEKMQISSQLLKIFQSKYAYYLSGQKLVFPIEDSLFQLYHELAQENQRNCAKIQLTQRRLAKNFCKELQLWNMLIEHPIFFQVNSEITIEDIPALIKQQKGSRNTKLFRNMHKFYINDIMINRYEQSSDQQYFSYVSLWRYADQNGFFERMFRTSWNQLVLFYISLQKNSYQNSQIREECLHFENILRSAINDGNFDIFSKYDDLIDYLIFLLNMCFETITFKSLINNKMLFFRDNNKMKNELLQQKKNIDNKLWDLKQHEKSLFKKQKINAKAMKRQAKMTVQEFQAYNQKIKNIQLQNEEIIKERQLIGLKRQEFQKNIVDIDNKIYELCCLPQFSNVWLLGEDRHHNSYWFIRESERVIYRESKETGYWGAIEQNNIQVLFQSLNIKGIRERKLYEKISYYKQLGYLKFGDQNMIQRIEKEEEIVCATQEIKEQQSYIEQEQTYTYDVSQFQRFSYSEYKKATPHIIKLMILKSQWMMSKYLFERNSKWINEQSRNQYINYIISHDLKNLESFSQELRLFNEKICVVEINIKVANQNEGIDLKTRKIQTKIWGINQKYKHFWYDYSKKCRNLSDLHFLVSILYLTIQKYVTKTRKPNNTKYFFKTVEIGQNQQNQEQYNEEEMLMN